MTRKELQDHILSINQRIDAIRSLLARKIDNNLRDFLIQEINGLEASRCRLQAQLMELLQK